MQEAIDISKITKCRKCSSTAAENIQYGPYVSIDTQFNDTLNATKK